MKGLISWLIAIPVFFVCCSTKEHKAGLQLMPEMVKTDSVQSIYFKSSDEPRFFTYVSVTDPAFIKSLVKDVTTETVIEKPCVKDGKIYCYKEDEIFNTFFCIPQRRMLVPQIY